MTGRISVELVGRAARMGAGVLAAVSAPTARALQVAGSAPTALALRVAGRTGMMLVCIAREAGFEVFTQGAPAFGLIRARLLPQLCSGLR